MSSGISSLQDWVHFVRFHLGNKMQRIICKFCEVRSAKRFSKNKSNLANCIFFPNERRLKWGAVI